MDNLNKFRKGILGIGIFLFLILSGVSTIYALDGDISETVIEIESLEEDLEIENTEDVIENSENINEIEETESVEIIETISYSVVVEKIVEALNERDSYFYEITNPTDIIKYVEDLGVELPEDLELGVTRVELARLLNDIAVAVANDVLYETDLIDIENIFIDLEGLSEEQIEDVETVFIMGLLSGVSRDKFNPNGLITESQLDIVLSRLKNGYSRFNLFNVVESGFTEEERLAVLEGAEDKELTYTDMINFLYMFSKAPNFNEHIEKVLTIGEFLELYYSETDYQILVQDEETKEFHYPAKDTIILSAEEWEYLNTHKDKIMLYSEAKLLSIRLKEAKDTIQEYNHFDSFEEIDNYSKNYLGFIYNLVDEYESCISYFMDYKRYNVALTNFDDFARSIHEVQHEGSAKLSNRFAGRRKSDEMWQIRWNSKPSVYYYFDFTNSTWIDSKVISTPNTSIIYNKECSEGVKEDAFLKDYATNYDLIANIYGIQGLLQEYCSYGLQAKIEFINESLDLDEGSVGHTDYDWYLMMKYMVMESLEYLKVNYNNSYMAFMNDTDMVRFLNNTFKEMDYYEDIYKDELRWYRWWFSDALLIWGYDLGCPVRFVDVEALVISENIESNIENKG